MAKTAKPLVKLHVANSYYYNCGMLLTNTLDLPADETVLKEKLKEIQGEDDTGYTVLRGDTPFKCTIPDNLDIIDLNRKLNMLGEKQINTLKVISDSGDLSLMHIVDLVFSSQFRIYENVTNEEDLGRRLYQEDQLPFTIPAYLEKYIDFKKLGHEICIKNSIRILPEMKLAERLGSVG